MNIGILTFYKVANFGANLQAISTYKYLVNNGYRPIFINYMSQESYERYKRNEGSIQWKEHIRTVDSIIENQTNICTNYEDINNVIKRYDIKAVIIGSDALLQHHPLISRIQRGRRIPIRIDHMDSDRLFPNPFWGFNFSKDIPVALMSVSSQNSSYGYFLQRTKRKMKEALDLMSYISVRDNWTYDMVKSTGYDKEIYKTPDPVFAFNKNAKEIIPTREDILKKYKLPESYILLSLHKYTLSKEVIAELRDYYASKSISLVFLPIPNGELYNSFLEYNIEYPLSPLDWFSIIKYSKGYIGSNMHPVVVSLHNAIPCYSIDNWGKKNFWGKKESKCSSKVFDILNEFGVPHNHSFIENGKCKVTAQEIIEKMDSFPKENIREIAIKMEKKYQIMMETILCRFSNEMFDKNE